jgi:hypothetical protein
MADYHFNSSQLVLAKKNLATDNDSRAYVS